MDPDLPSSSLAVVLVRARNPLNVGAAARAMSNFGVKDLRVVGDYLQPLEAARSAIDAAPVLASAQAFSSVAEAIADCTLVYGTTALGDRDLHHPVDVLRDAPSHVRQNPGRTAILFGSEKTGLSNDELSHCHRLLTIPMARGGVSMNLGQAVAVCLYELHRDAPAQRNLPEPAAAATADDLDRFESLLRETLTAAEYDRRFPGNMGANETRELVRRLGLTSADTTVWMGMLRQVLWKLRQAGR
ncbi:RNA methyltransferase [Terriglobus aquaticus]|uniref:RNA methyltransferase n=1 Tax=Terriglobus aquaticus TaxID=940139 RepID=A0ABW9KHP8_9BACT|nr:RNA methyltransferase [Terriglobus aquaticus]